MKNPWPLHVQAQTFDITEVFVNRTSCVLRACGRYVHQGLPGPKISCQGNNPARHSYTQAPMHNSHEVLVPDHKDKNKSSSRKRNPAIKTVKTSEFATMTEWLKQTFRHMKFLAGFLAALSEYRTFWLKSVLEGPYIHASAYVSHSEFAMDSMQNMCAKTGLHSMHILPFCDSSWHAKALFSSFFANSLLPPRCIFGDLESERFDLESERFDSSMRVVPRDPRSLILKSCGLTTNLGLQRSQDKGTAARRSSSVFLGAENWHGKTVTANSQTWTFMPHEAHFQFKSETDFKFLRQIKALSVSSVHAS